MKSRRVLIVDHSRQMRENLLNLLDGAHVELFEADSAEMALDLMQRASFDVVLTETELPNRSGHHLLREIKTIHPDTEVLFVTHNASSHNMLQALRYGVFDFIVRPIDSGEIISVALDKVFAVIDKRRSEQDRFYRLSEANRQIEYQLELKSGILKAAEKFSKTVEIQGLMTELIASSMEIFHASRGFIALIDKANQSLVIKAGKGIPDEIISQYSRGLGSGLTDKLVKGSKPLWVSGSFPVKLTQMFNEAEEAGLFVNPGMLSTPLQIKGKVAGIIVISGRKIDTNYSEEDLRMLMKLVKLATISLEKSGIIHQLKSSRAANMPQSQ